jgi:Flp pilus assembly protein TadD
MPLSQGTGSAEDRALGAGDRAVDAGDLVLALRSYELARGLAPKSAAPLVGLARVRVAKADIALDYAAGKGNGEILAARAMLKRAVAMDGDSAAAQLELGRVLLLLGDADGAMGSLRRALVLAPHEAEAHSVLGVALLATGHAEDALVELRAAATLDMGTASRHGNLGTACLMNGKVPDAVKEYELQVRLADGDARAHSDLGTALLAGGGDGDLARGIAELRRALALDPSRATFHSNLGYALQLQGAVPEAVAEYRRALSIDPHLASAWINLATALAKDPKTRGEARNALGEAQKIDPTDPRVKANLNELDALEHGTTTP